MSEVWLQEDEDQYRVQEGVDKVRVKSKKVAGFGINDADYFTSRRLDGKMVHCEIYKKWFGLINRAYGDFQSQGKGYYEGTTVSSQWQRFMDFREWYKGNSVEGWSLDKDLLYPDNKEYGPDTCIFIPRSVNTAITLTRKTKWNTLPGVTLDHRSRVNRFVTPGFRSSDEAAVNEFYRKRKAKEIFYLIADNEYSDVINDSLLVHRHMLLMPQPETRYVRRRTLGAPIPNL